MSQKAIAEIISRALSNPRFRKSLIRHPDKALAGYDLTREEIALIVLSLAKDQAATSAAELDERVSQARFPLGFLGGAARLVVDADDMPDMPVPEPPEPPSQIVSRVTTGSARPAKVEPTEATATVQDGRRESPQQSVSAGTEARSCADPTAGADPEISCGGASEIEAGG